MKGTLLTTLGPHQFWKPLMIPIYRIQLPFVSFPRHFVYLYHKINHIQLYLLVHLSIPPTILNFLGIGNEYLGYVLCLAHRMLNTNSVMD